MIRSFERKDIKEITALGMELHENFSKTNDLFAIYENLYTKIIVYEDNSKILGFLMYTELEDTVDIVDLIVDKNHRNKKIASCLLDYLISGLPKSVKLITLEVRKSNQPAIHLYEKFGFEIIHIRTKYYEEEDAYLMGRMIKE